MTVDYPPTRKPTAMPMTSMISVESVRNFLLRHDGSVTQNHFLDQFHGQLTHATTDSNLREKCKDVLRLTTMSEMKDGNKYIVLATNTDKSDECRHRNIFTTNKNGMMTQSVFRRSGNDLMSGKVPQKLKKLVASTRRTKWNLPVRSDIKNKRTEQQEGRYQKRGHENRTSRNRNDIPSEKKLNSEKTLNDNPCPNSASGKVVDPPSSPAGYRRRFLMKPAPPSTQSSHNRRSCYTRCLETLTHGKRKTQSAEKIGDANIGIMRTAGNFTPSETTCGDFFPPCNRGSKDSPVTKRSIKKDGAFSEPTRRRKLTKSSSETIFYNSISSRSSSNTDCSKEDDALECRLKREITIFDDVVYYPVLDANLNTTSLVDDLQIDTLGLNFTQNCNLSTEEVREKPITKWQHEKISLRHKKTLGEDILEDNLDDKHVLSDDDRETSLLDDDSTTDDSGFDAESSDGSVLFLNNDLRDNFSIRSTPKRHSLLCIRWKRSGDFERFQKSSCENASTFDAHAISDMDSGCADSVFIDSYDVTFLDLIDDEILQEQGNSISGKMFNDARKSGAKDEVSAKIRENTRKYKGETSACICIESSAKIDEPHVRDSRCSDVENDTELCSEVSGLLEDILKEVSVTETVNAILTELLSTIENSQIKRASTCTELHSDTSSLDESSASDTSSLDETKSLSPSTTSKISRLEVRPEEKDWMLACTQGNLSELQDLVTQHPNLLHKQDFLTGYTVLHWAAKLGRTDMIEFALTQGLNVDVRSCGGYTPLHIAAQCGRDQAIAELVYQGADVERRAPLGHKPRDIVKNSCSYDVQAKLGKFVCTGSHNRVIRRNLLKMK